MIPQSGHKKHINAKYEGKQLKGEQHDKWRCSWADRHGEWWMDGWMRREMRGVIERGYEGAQWKMKRSTWGPTRGRRGLKLRHSLNLHWRPWPPHPSHYTVRVKAWQVSQLMSHLCCGFKPLYFSDKTKTVLCYLGLNLASCTVCRVALSYFLPYYLYSKTSLM